MLSRLTSLFLRTLLVLPLLALPRPGRAQDSAAPALSYLADHRAQLGLSAADVADPLVTDAYLDAHNGVRHVYLRQRYQGLEVLGAELSLHFDRQGQLLMQSGAFVPNLAAAVKSTAPAFTPLAATGTAARALGLAPQQLRAVTAARPGAGAAPANQFLLRDEAISRADIPVRLVLVRQLDGPVQLAWDLELTPPGTTHRWRTRVDATTGQVLSQTDRIIHEQLRPGAAPTPLAAAEPAATSRRGTAADGATYNVFPFPLEGPGFGPRSLLTSPADPLASPFGWHDTDGKAGAEYTITRGNNVYVFNGLEQRPGYSPDGGASLRFDFPYDISRPPLSNRDAAMTNLFYLNNAVHDVSFQYGFDEVSGNFQTTNYTGKGKGHDAVLAVAQDADGTDNAYFSPGADGDSSSMHMFLWPRPFRLQFMVTAPASIAGSYAAVEGQLGPSFPASLLSGKLVVVNDGSAMPTTACATGVLANAADVQGNIAVIDRGGCNFSVKILAAQKAGAVAAVVVNNADGAPIVMGGTADGITIPALMITQADGNRLKAALAGGAPVTVSVQRLAPLEADRDGAFDNGIVAHEYTHGISTRLTGGPSRNDCLPTSNGKKTTDPAYVPYETMGEGWSDFFGLWFTTRPGDQGAAPRAVGTYVLAEASTGAGIRNKPYSTDFTLNDETYALIGKPYTETHDIGEVWAAVLWDLNWAMIEKYGYNADLYHGTGGNNKTMQLVMDGMKLQPCQPGFLTGRDAILKADIADFKGADLALIWRVFARRGMGVDAVQGTVSALDNKAGFVLPVDEPLTTAAVSVFPNPSRDGLATLRASTGGLSVLPEITLTVFTMLGQSVYTAQLSSADLRQGVPLDLRRLASGLYVLRLQAPTSTISKKLMVQR